MSLKVLLPEVQKQIGNAVMVNLAAALGCEVAKYFEKRKKTGILKVASYFTGAGGLDLGFEMASKDLITFKTVCSTDIEPWVEATIKFNRPQWNFHRADIRELDPKLVKKVIGERPDLIIGGPPCQPFSVAGKQRATKDSLGVLYRDYLQHINELKPEIVVMENVYGLARVKSANMMQEIYASFKEIGYDVTHRELMAADYGTPQKRRRLIFVAGKDLGFFQFPTPTHCETENLLGLPLYKGAGEALKKLPKARVREQVKKPGFLKKPGF